MSLNDVWDIQERTDSIHLLVSIICQRKEEWTGLILALTCNAVAHFYIYRPRFWRQASMSLMRLLDLVDSAWLSRCTWPPYHQRTLYHFCYIYSWVSLGLTAAHNIVAGSLLWKFCRFIAAQVEFVNSLYPLGRLWPGLVWTMSPLELFMIVSAMARVDRRDEAALRMLAKMCHRCAQRRSAQIVACAASWFEAFWCYVHHKCIINVS